MLGAMREKGRKRQAGRGAQKRDGATERERERDSEAGGGGGMRRVGHRVKETETQGEKK